jgi:two-component system sensor histidine kinase RegB
MALLAGELANDTSLSDAVREDIALLRQQIGVCKQIITGLSRRAGAERLDNVESVPADRWLDSLRQHWHAARPQAGSRLIIASDGSAPAIAADPRLEQAILNLLNNAANATPRPLEIRLSWCSETCASTSATTARLSSDILAAGGQSSFPHTSAAAGGPDPDPNSHRTTRWPPDPVQSRRWRRPARIELPRAKP